MQFGGREGVITLSGEVADGEICKAAEEIAAKQPGVVAVINGLEVKPGGKSGEELAPAVVAPAIMPCKGDKIGR